MDYQKELALVLKAAQKAKKIIMKYYKEGFDVEIKSDDSPVTQADKESNNRIIEILASEFTDYGFLTEETDDDKIRLTKEFIWIIDPLDGTVDFVNHYDEFTINIALCKDHQIVLGVVCVPVYNVTYYAIKGQGAYKIDENGQTKQIKCSDKTSDLTVLKSRFHSTDKEEATYLKYQNKFKEVLTAGSSLKACLIAEGKAELSYRFSRGTKEWDTAAFQIIVEEAGGLVLKLDKTPLTYNREDVYNDSYVIMNNIKNMYI